MTTRSDTRIRALAGGRGTVDVGRLKAAVSQPVSLASAFAVGVLLVWLAVWWWPLSGRRMWRIGGLCRRRNFCGRYG